MQHDQSTFPHHRLDAYVVSLQLAGQAKSLADRVPRGHRTLADKLMRAAGSIVLNIAEGANRYTAGQKRQRFTEARGECGEVAAAGELLATLGLVPDEEAARLQQTAGRVAAMLTGLIRRLR